MEIAMADTRIKRSVARCASQATIEGDVPIPQGRTPSSLLYATAVVNVTGAQSVDGRVLIEGKLCVYVLLEDDELFSFVSNADFRHTVECAEAKVGMGVCVQAELNRFDSSLDTARNCIAINGLADMFCRVESDSSQVIPQKDMTNNMQIKYVHTDFMQSTPVGSKTVHLREEIIAADVSNVIMSSGVALIRDISSTNDIARVEGIIALNMLCQTSDENLVSVTQNIPFVADVPTDSTTGSTLVGDVKTLSVSAHPVGEEFGVVCVETQLQIDLSECAAHSAEIPIDAFCVETPIECQTVPQQLMLFKGRHEQRSQFRQTLSTTQNKLSRAIHARVTPIITSATQTDSGIDVEGLAVVYALYTDDAKQLRVHKEEVPYSVMMNIPYVPAELDAAVTCLNAGVSANGEGGMELTYTLHVNAVVYELIEANVLAGVVPTAATTQKVKGFVIAVAQNGETLYDLAKRLNVTRETLRAQNPNLHEPISAGDKAMVLM